MTTSPWQKEWNYVLRQEYDFLRKGRFKKDSALNRFLSTKVPEGLQNTLDTAFAKAFDMIFQKGTAFIEKTYDKEGIETQYKINEYSASLRNDRNSLHLFSKKAANSGNKNLLFSGVEGIGLGALGIGLPDIPLFTAMLLKSVYEVALHFGYSYESEEEKYFILKIIQGALAHGKELDLYNNQLNDYIENNELPDGYDQAAQIRASAETMSSELLYMKFLQGVPVVGAVGGAYDVVYMQKVQKYARLKYHRRFLADRANGGFTSIPGSSDMDDGPDLA
jgi:hypothetical protein